MLNQKGLSSIEILPIVVIFIIMINFGMGFFGVIHTGILNSIGARNYAFETFRSRANLKYLRDVAGSNTSVNYDKIGFRYHSIIAEDATNTQSFSATQRAINFANIASGTDVIGAGGYNKAKGIAEGKKVSDQGVNDGADPVWILSAYGICLNNNCGK